MTAVQAHPRTSTAQAGIPVEPATRAAAILLGGGSGSRVGADVNKVLLPLAGVPVWQWSLRTIHSLGYVDHVVVVARPEDVLQVKPHLRGATLVIGGQERHDSEWNGLQALAALIDDGEVDVVAIHDAARPLAPAGLWHEVVRAASECGGAIPVRPQSALLTTSGQPVGDLVGVQTPQAFQAKALLAAYRAAEGDGFRGTDTAACLERYADVRIHGVPAPATNLKITFPEDVAVAERILLRSETA